MSHLFRLLLALTLGAVLIALAGNSITRSAPYTAGGVVVTYPDDWTVTLAPVAEVWSAESPNRVVQAAHGPFRDPALRWGTLEMALIRTVEFYQPYVEDFDLDYLPDYHGLEVALVNGYGPGLLVILLYHSPETGNGYLVFQSIGLPSERDLQNVIDTLNSIRKEGVSV